MEPGMSDTVAARLDAVRRRIAAAARRAGRAAGEIRLVAVSKGRSDAAVRDAYTAGQRVFGENRPEALAARAAAGWPDDVEWHMIGHVQRRKLGLVLAHAAMLESMDRLRLAEAMAPRGATLPVLVEVNVAREPQKHGFVPDELDEALVACGRLGLHVRGLMAIPPRPEDPEDSRPWFERMAELAARTRRRHPETVELSMGMSDDFEVAVECGATIVRVGRAIFGVRTASESTPDPETR